jgi:hypothetical protein
MSDRDRKVGFVNKYLPVFIAASPKDYASSASIPADGAFSFFTRWILPKHHAEFYLEYGYNDFKQNLRDLATNANHSSAYIIGFKKIVVLPNKQLLDISSELTQMAQTTSYVVRSAGNWYEHGSIFQGFTYQNQIMGAGSGMGNNVQTIQVKKINGLSFDEWLNGDPFNKYGIAYGQEGIDYALKTQHLLLNHITDMYSQNETNVLNLMNNLETHFNVKIFRL